MVSVSRFAGLPHDGHLVSVNDGSLLSGLPVPSGTTFSGSFTGSGSSRTRTPPPARDGARGDSRTRRAPVARARDSPVAQAPLHLFLAQLLLRQVGGDGVHRLLIGLAI